MSRTNCVNCGAAIDTDEIKCPFCGTTYLDMTAIDFNTDKPVVCKFLLPGTDRYVLSMLALPMLDDIVMQDETVSVESDWSVYPVATLTTGMTVTADVRFKAVPHPKTDTLFTIKGAP